MLCRGTYKQIAGTVWKNPAARLSRQWMKDRGMIDMLVKSWVHIFSGSFGSAHLVDAWFKVALYSVV